MTASEAPAAMLMRATPIRSNSATAGVPARATMLIGAPAAFTSRAIASISASANG
jgi:hypothetical protein